MLELVEAEKMKEKRDKKWGKSLEFELMKLPKRLHRNRKLNIQLDRSSGLELPFLLPVVSVKLLLLLLSHFSRVRFCATP